MDDNNWDLFAVVRGCSTTGVTAAPDSLVSTFMLETPPMLKEREFEGEIGLLGVPEVTETPALSLPASRYDRLEELCRPFFDVETQPILGKQWELQQLLKPCCYDFLSPKSSALSDAPSEPRQLLQRQQRPRPQIPRSKRKKNQQKKVVCYVAADAVSSDLWTWRKYGQKPIKGSPYPRGYYRCSNSKGCQARKQVERSRADHAILIITYTAEHNHPVSTHRNSLAGSTRQKCTPPPVSSSTKQSTCSPSAASDGGDQRLQCHNNPSSWSPESPPVTAPGPSPTTHLAPMTEDDVLRRPRRVDQEEGEVDDEGEEVITVGDMEMMGEGEMIFLGMEVIRGPSTTEAGPK